jgi:hypothetical protein
VKQNINIEPLLLTTTRVQTFTGARLLSSASGFFFERQDRLFLGFPLGFHDELHHLPVVRQAVIASSFGLRFQGKGYFLTDARTLRRLSLAAGHDHSI